MPGDVVIDLPRAEDEPRHVLLIRFRVVDHLSERAVRKIGERRGRLLQTQQPFRRHHHQRAARCVERLTADQIEVLP